MAHRDLAAFIVTEPKLGAICSTIKPRKSKRNARSEVAALVVAWTCATTSRLLPPGYAERLRGLPFGDVPAVHFTTADEAEALASEIVAAGRCRAGQRDAVALLEWWVNIGLPPSEAAALAFGVAFGLIDGLTGAPTMPALGIILGTRLPEMVRDAAVRDGEWLAAHAGEPRKGNSKWWHHAPLAEHVAVIGSDPASADRRALRLAWKRPAYRSFAEAIARSIAPDCLSVPAVPKLTPTIISSPLPPKPEPLAQPESIGLRFQQSHAAVGLRSIAVPSERHQRGTVPSRWTPASPHRNLDHQHRTTQRSN